MTIAITRSIRQGTVDCHGARIRAHCRHLATVITIQGDIDAVNADRVGRHIRRFTLADNPVLLDVSGVSQFTPAAIALLYAFDEDCRATGVEWTLVASPENLALLGDVFSAACSVREALRNLADDIVSRRQLVLPLIKKSA